MFALCSRKLLRDKLEIMKKMLDGSGLETHYIRNVDRPTVIANNYANFFENWIYFSVQASQAPRIGAITCVYLLNSAAQVVQVPRLNFLARPGSLAQECEAGLYRRIILETTDWDSTPHFVPAMPLNKLIDDVFQGDAVQGIAGIGSRWCHRSVPLGVQSQVGVS